MRQSAVLASAERGMLRDLTAQIGRDRSLTQGSTGNSSAKIDEDFWIKRSGRWMSAALREDIFIRLDMDLVRDCLRRNLDPSECFAGASLETAMHAVIPHRVVVHVHSVNVIAWAVRSDGISQIQTRLAGLPWQWIPYLPSGLRLAAGIERALKRRPDTNVFVLANHGLVVGGDDVPSVRALLSAVHQKLDAPTRLAPPADRQILVQLAADSTWQLPADEEIHFLATDPVCQRIIARGFLYPCQAIFSGPEGLDTFRAINKADMIYYRESTRPFLLVDGCGVLVNRKAGAAAVAMLTGLAQVARRLGASSPIRYMTDAEMATLSPEVADRYQRLAGAGSDQRASLGAVTSTMLAEGPTT